MQYKIITCALLVVTFLSSCLSKDTRNDDCNSLTINEDNFSSNFEGILSVIQSGPRTLFLNYAGGNYFNTMRLAKIVSEKKIPVMILSGSICLNDCSAVYLASPKRFSKSPLRPPQYAVSEMDKISRLSVIDIYPIVEDEAMLSVISSHLSENEINFIRTNVKNENFEELRDLNTVTIEEVKILIKNAQECIIPNMDRAGIESQISLD